MKTRFAQIIASCLLVLLSIACGPREESESAPVKLVLFLTIDQLRGQTPERMKDSFGSGGFRYLMDRGVHYTNAHYQGATSLTAVGHATLFTGGLTAQHGLPGNEWYDRHQQRRVYCVMDDRYTIIGNTLNELPGTSPQHLTSKTIGDALTIASERRSKVFSVSIKDRGAIIPGGELGTAFWYSKSSGRFVSSSYYFTELPAWAARQWSGLQPKGRESQSLT